jgi:NAD(P)-dependent dehydrogenase (short-subunit alcohol dehydrogenase family)
MPAMTDHSRIVLITGATGHLGRAAARAFAADGARLGLLGTDLGRLQAVAHDLGIADDAWTPGVADLRDGGAAQAAITGITDRLGPVDVLLHLVGGWSGGAAIADVEPDVLRDMLEQHLWSTFHVVRAVVPGMVERRDGRILAVTSTLTTSPTALSGAYLAAKSAQEVMLRSLAREVAKSGVTVNVVAVKAIDAERQRETAPSAKNAGWTTPSEIVEVLRYLASSQAAAVNGQRIALDGRG